MNKFLCFFISTFALVNSAFSQYSYVIQPRSYLFSTEYDIHEEQGVLTTIENNSLQLRRIYSLCDRSGEFGRGIARLFSLGCLFNCLKEIDCYDEFNRPIGLIQGHWWTTAAAQFTFSDATGFHYATAYIDRNYSTVNIVDAQNERIPLAVFRRHLVPGGGDYHWDVTVLEPHAINQKMVQIFSAFVTDACWPIAEGQRESALDILHTGIIIHSLLNDE